MATTVNHYKLGLFFILGVSIAVLAGALFGAAQFGKETVRYHSYFNESVQGLDLGAPVKFRGVTIGSVSAIEIAPDHRMVDVACELDTTEVMRMGLTEAGTDRGAARFAIPHDLRAQLNSQGITGVKFVAIDFFDVRSNPAPELPFPVPPQRYIPAASSMMKNLEDTFATAMERLPEMVDAVVMIMGRVDGLVEKLETQDVSGEAVTMLRHAGAAMATLQNTLARIDAQDLGRRVSGTITNLDVAVKKMDTVLDTLGGQKGLLVSAQRATDAFGDVGREGRGTQRDLGEALRGVSEAADAIRVLAEALERDPDMLLKGKAVRRTRP